MTSATYFPLRAENAYAYVSRDHGLAELGIHKANLVNFKQLLALSGRYRH